MKRRIALILAIFSSCFGCEKQVEHSKPLEAESLPIVEAVIGKPLPAKYAVRGGNMGAFSFVSVPVLHPLLQVEMQQVNLFTEIESGLVSGYRGDRAMESEGTCLAAAARIEKVLQAKFPIRTGKIEPERRYSSRDGLIEAGVLCTAREPIATLTLVVSNPTIEDRMMERVRSEGANKTMEPTR